MGGRGSGAVADSLSINEGVQLVAASDLYAAKAAALRKHLEKFEGKVAIDETKIHGGLDGYRQVFAEKPVLFDPAGYRICLEAHEKALANGTSSGPAATRFASRRFTIWMRSTG